MLFHRPCGRSGKSRDSTTSVSPSQRPRDLELFDQSANAVGRQVPRFQEAAVLETQTALPDTGRRMNSRRPSTACGRGRSRRPAREEAEETERRPDTAAAAGRPGRSRRGPRDAGSNRGRGRARKGYEPWRPILVEVELRGPVKTPTFRAIAQEAAEMLERGLRLSAIARHFGVDYHTVDKAIRWYRWRCFVISRSAVRVRSPAPDFLLSFHILTSAVRVLLPRRLLA